MSDTARTIQEITGMALDRMKVNLDNAMQAITRTTLQAKLAAERDEDQEKKESLLHLLAYSYNQIETYAQKLMARIDACKTDERMPDKVGARLGTAEPQSAPNPYDIMDEVVDITGYRTGSATIQSMYTVIIMALHIAQEEAMQTEITNALDLRRGDIVTTQDKEKNDEISDL